MPLETMSLPTKATCRSRSGSRRAIAAAASAASRVKADSSATAPSAAGLGRLALQRRREPGQPARGLVARARAELLDVDAGRAQPGARAQLGVVHRLPQALGGVARADEHGGRVRDALAGGRQEALGVALDDVLERAAVDLDGVGHAALERAGDDQRAHDEVVRQRRVGRGVRHDVAHRRNVAGDVVLDLLVGALQERARLECPRSGRRRRPGAGRRCPAATPSRAGGHGGPRRAGRRPPTSPRRRRSRAHGAAAPAKAGPRSGLFEPKLRKADCCRRSTRSRAEGSRGRRAGACGAGA